MDPGELENEIIECIRSHFGLLAEKVYDDYKTRLGITPDSNKEDWQHLIDELSKMLRGVASGFIGNGLQNDLQKIVEKYIDGAKNQLEAL